MANSEFLPPRFLECKVNVLFIFWHPQCLAQIIVTMKIGTMRMMMIILIILIIQNLEKLTVCQISCKALYSEFLYLILKTPWVSFLLLPFYRWGNWCLERLSHLPKVIASIKGRIWVQIYLVPDSGFVLRTGLNQYWETPENVFTYPYSFICLSTVFQNINSMTSMTWPALSTLVTPAPNTVYYT